MGSVSGSVVGVVLVTVVSELLRNAERGLVLGALRIPPLYGASQMLMAVILVLVIVFRPKGLMGGRARSTWEASSGGCAGRGAGDQAA